MYPVIADWLNMVFYPYSDDWLRLADLITSLNNRRWLADLFTLNNVE